MLTNRRAYKSSRALKKTAEGSFLEFLFCIALWFVEDIVEFIHNATIVKQN